MQANPGYIIMTSLRNESHLLLNYLRALSEPEIQVKSIHSFRLCSFSLFIRRIKDASIWVNNHVVSWREGKSPWAPLITPAFSFAWCESFRRQIVIVYGRRLRVKSFGNIAPANEKTHLVKEVRRLLHWLTMIEWIFPVFCSRLLILPMTILVPF